MRQAGSAESIVLLDIFHHQGGLVDDGIFSDAGFKINAIAGFDKFSQAHGGFYLKCLGFVFVECQNRTQIRTG